MRERPCSVALSRSALKDMDRLNDSDAKRAMEALLSGKPLRGSLTGARRIDFGLSGGWYRAAYRLETETASVLVFMVGPRGGFYDEATRRWRALRRA